MRRPFPADLPPLPRRLYASRGVRSARELEAQRERNAAAAAAAAWKITRWGSLQRLSRKRTLLLLAILTPTARPVLCAKRIEMRALGCDNISYIWCPIALNGYGFKPGSGAIERRGAQQHRLHGQRHFIPRRRSACKRRWGFRYS